MVKLKKIWQSTYLLMHNRKIVANCNSKLIKICSNKKLESVDAQTQRQYLQTWSALKCKPNLLFLKCMYSVSKVKSPLFVPEDVFYTRVEPVLNNRVYAVAYNDKNFFERYLHEFKELFPRVFLRGVNGVFYGPEYEYVPRDGIKGIIKNLDCNLEYILKPATETGAGDDVRLVRVIGESVSVNQITLTIDQFIDSLGKHKFLDFVFQERILQCEWFKHFCPEATNIIRVFSYRSVVTNEVYILHSYFRYGYYKDTFEVYLKNGGLRHGIRSDGTLADYPINYYGNIQPSNLLSDSIDRREVPKYKEIVGVVRAVGEKFYHHRLLGFDFIVDSQDRVRLLEVNLRNIGMIHHQMINGPLFGEFTNEVVDYCSLNRKSASSHFYY